MKNLIKVIGLAASFLLATVGNATLPGGISGHWYNPEQSGHGLTITLAQPDFAVVVWHVFDTEGEPMTLYIEGNVSDHRIEGTAYAPKGMRFGEFDTADLELPVWGQISLDFDSCTRADLSWDSSDPAFGSGTMPLERLAFTAGLDCSLPPPGNPVPGLYTGQVIRVGSELGTNFEGIVDLEGRLWGMERGTYPIPSPMWVGAHLPWVVYAEPITGDGTTELDGRASRMRWTFTTPQEDSHPAAGAWMQAEPGGELTWVEGDEEVWTLEWWPAENAGTSMIAPVSMELLAGRYRLPMSDQNPQGSTVWFDIDDQGHVCIDMSPWHGESGGCHFSGQVSLTEGHLGLIDFELQRPEHPVHPAYSGRGWLADGQDGIELVLIGSNGVGGFGLVAYPDP